MRLVEKVWTILVVAFVIVSCKTHDKSSGMSVVEYTVDTLVHHQSPRLVVIYENENFSEGGFGVANSSNDPMKWRFAFSDSLRERTKYMYMIFQHSQDTIHKIYFKLPDNLDQQLAIDLFLLNDCESATLLKFFGQNTVEPCPFTGWKTMLMTHYLIRETNDMELQSSVEATPGYSSFLNTDYESGLEKYAELAAKYPNSRFLIARVASMINQYRSKDDIRKVYDCFSEENKSGYWGSKIADYLATDHFENMELPAWDTRKPEPIITDASKPNLVVFSASWCAPCHAMIPLLKEIHTDLGDRLDIVYVSVDKPETADAWAETMQNEHIPWRSVMALERTAEVHNKYFVGGIPHQILVYPDGTMEKIEIRQKEGKEKLYAAGS